MDINELFSLKDAESGTKESSNFEPTYKQKVLSKAYDNYNPEIQKKNELKLKQMKIDEAYKLLTKSTPNRRIPYSAISKFIYEYCQSDIKY